MAPCEDHEIHFHLSESENPRLGHKVVRIDVFCGFIAFKGARMVRARHTGLGLDMIHANHYVGPGQGVESGKKGSTCAPGWSNQHQQSSMMPYTSFV